MKTEQDPGSKGEGVIGEVMEDKVRRLTAEVGRRPEFRNKEGIRLGQLKNIYPGINNRTIDRAVEDGLVSKEMSRKSTRVTISIPDVITLLCLNSSDRMKPQDRNKVPRLARKAFNEYTVEQEKARNK